MHGPQAVQALRAGKHVYSAVPSAISVEEMTELVRAVEETGQIYVIGETSCYYPAAIYCRERFARGDFGRVVYGEAEYYHDMSAGLYEVNQWRFGDDWKKYAGSPPLHYPTHSTGFIVCVTGARAMQVCALGYEDGHEDQLFGAGRNVWDNPFSNETMLCRMSDGSVARINEFRRVAAHAVRLRLYGTDGSYEEGAGHHAWTGMSSGFEDITAKLECSGIALGEIEGAMAEIRDEETFKDVSSVHPVGELPREFAGLPNGHCGSHQFLVHEFITSIEKKSMPLNNVWQAARYLVPGLVAHESAMQNGAWMEVPDFGDAPNQ